jgi:hypothetical protein
LVADDGKFRYDLGDGSAGKGGLIGGAPTRRFIFTNTLSNRKIRCNSCASVRSTIDIVLQRVNCIGAGAFRW